MAVTVTPTTWDRDPLSIDPSAHVMQPVVTGAAPGTWEVGDGGAYGFYLHIRHNGAHIGMANWNHWDAVAVHIEHESGPYAVTVVNECTAVHTPGLTLTEAWLHAYRAKKIPGATATVTNPDGNEVRWPRHSEPTED